MRIIIDEYGSYLRKEGNRFQVIQNKEKKKEFSADKINQILLFPATAISGEAIKLASDKGIDIVYLNYFGEPFARTYPCKLGGTTLTRKKQVQVYFSDKSSNIAKGVVTAKTKNQIYFLKALAKDRKNQEISNTANNLTSFIKKIHKLEGNVDKIRDALLGIEGYVANQYFYILSKILPFKNRDPKANDYFNIVLNYAYGMLYSEIEKACILAGLDPYLGFFHLDRYNKPCLVLDLIEEFRTPIADRVVVTLFTRSQINKDDFENQGEKILSPQGRKKVIEAVMKRLHTKIKFKGKNQKFESIILEQARHLTRYLLGHDREYKPFIYRW